MAILSYSACVSNVAMPTGATDFFTILGSSNTNVRVTGIEIDIQGSESIFNVLLIKRSSLNQGGTSVIVPNVSHISSLSPANAIVQFYSVNPTLGTQVGIVRSLNIGVSRTPVGPTFLSWEFGEGAASPIFLIGPNELLALNFGGQTTTGLILSASIEWVEELAQ